MSGSAKCHRCMYGRPKAVCFFIATATPEIYTLSLHDALPIFRTHPDGSDCDRHAGGGVRHPASRSEEHTSELQSHSELVCRLLLEKKKTERLRARLAALKTDAGARPTRVSPTNLTAPSISPSD